MPPTINVLRNLFRTHLALLAVLFTCLLPAAETLTVTFGTTAPGGEYANANANAVWLEDSTTTFKGTVGSWAATTGNGYGHLAQWRAKKGSNTVDAKVGATRSNHNGTVTTKSLDVSALADGTYKVWFETVDSNGVTAGTTSVARAVNRFSFSFTKNGTAQTAQSVTDPAGKFTSITYTYTGRAAVPVISTTALPNGQVGVAYSQTLAATNSPTSWTVTVGSLPGGLALATATGIISGTPTSAGTSNFTVTASNAGGTSAPQALSITVLPAIPVISTTSLPGGTVGTAYSQTLAATNSPTAWTVTVGTLPAGLTLTSATGIISGTPTTAGTSNFTVTASNTGGTSAGKALSIVISAAAIPVISTTSLPGGTVGTAYSQTLAATNNPTAWAVSAGTLPAGLTLAAGTGVISGTPTTAGTSNFTVTASNAGGTSTGKALSIVVLPLAPVVSTVSLPAGTVGTAYNQTLAASNTPTSWAVTVGSLPTGLSLAAGTGVISGTPTAAGTSTFTVTASNAGGTSPGKSLSISVNTAGAPVITSATTATTTVNTTYSYQITASGSPTSFNATSLPTGLTVATGTGVISGTPTATGTFNVTISATSAGGTGSTILVLTVNPAIPVISTTALTNGVIGTAYSQTLAASNTPTTWAVTVGSLPAGLSLATGTGVISGTPTTAAVSTFTVTASNAGGTSTGKSLSITVAGPVPVITTATLPGGTSGTAYNQTLAATNTPTTWALISGNLPPGLTLGTASGLISGTPSAEGTYSFTVTAGNTHGTSAAKSLSITVIPQIPVITTTTLPAGVAGQTYQQILVATPTPTSWTKITGALPSGLSLDTTTGIISGTPVAGGTATFTVTASNAGGTSASQALTLQVFEAPVVTVQPPATASVDLGAKFSLSVTATGLPAPLYQWSLDGADIPGATEATFTVAAAKVSDAGIYVCAVANDYGTVLADSTLVTVVVAPPVIVGGATATFTSSPSGGSYANKHILAVWIERPNGTLVRTLAFWASARTANLTRWQAKTPSNDANMGATLTAHQTRSADWDLKDSVGAVVANGSYRLWVESVDDNTPAVADTSVPGANRAFLDFTVANGAVMTAGPKDLGGFTKLSIGPGAGAGGGSSGPQDSPNGGCGHASASALVLSLLAFLGLRRRARVS